ncbi:MAG: hypothetical protein PHV06_10075, partial [bacterium]|nr:hypothetical protein [bacterium]
MNKFKLLIILISILSFILSISALETGTNAAAFLKINISPRSSGMGDCFVGIADDYNAAQWNPGGLGTIEKG